MRIYTAISDDATHAIQFRPVDSPILRRLHITYRGDDFGISSSEFPPLE